MGNCLYILERPDLNGPTFSHYSLTSSDSYIDLYPGLSYVESESSSNKAQWRRSSAPLLDSESSQRKVLHTYSSTTLRTKMLSSSSSSNGLKTRIRASTTQLLHRRSVTLENSSLDKRNQTISKSSNQDLMLAESRRTSDHDLPELRKRGKLATSSSDVHNRDSCSTVMSQL